MISDRLDEMYYKISMCKDDIDLLILTMEIEDFIIDNNELTKTETRLLRATIRIKALEASVLNLIAGFETLIIAGGFAKENTESAILAEMEDDELDLLKNGNVVTIDSLGKKDDDKD